MGVGQTHVTMVDGQGGGTASWRGSRTRHSRHCYGGGERGCLKGDDSAPRAVSGQRVALSRFPTPLSLLTRNSLVQEGTRPRELSHRCRLLRR